MDKEANKYYLGPAPLVEMARRDETPCSVALVIICMPPFNTISTHSLQPNSYNQYTLWKQQRLSLFARESNAKHSQFEGKTQFNHKITTIYLKVNLKSLQIDCLLTLVDSKRRIQCMSLTHCGHSLVGDQLSIWIKSASMRSPCATPWIMLLILSKYEVFRDYKMMNSLSRQQKIAEQKH